MFLGILFYTTKNAIIPFLAATVIHSVDTPSFEPFSDDSFELQFSSR